MGAIYSLGKASAKGGGNPPTLPGRPAQVGPGDLARSAGPGKAGRPRVEAVSPPPLQWTLGFGLDLLL